MDPDLQAACRTDLELRFLTALESSPCGVGDVYLWPGFPLITTWCVCEPTSAILRTLRADFNGTQLRCGNDPNHNMDLKLDRSDPDYVEGRAGEEPEAAAEVAARWFETQLDRPIDRYEWRDGTYRRWVLADTAVALSSQITGGPSWQAGGAWDATQPPPGDPPEKIVRVWPPTT